MRKPEQRLWDSMATHRPPDFWLERVENIVAAGTPDVTAMTRGFISKIELKATTAPLRTSTRLLGEKGLSVAQIGWQRKAASLDLPVYTLIREIGTKELFMIPCTFANVVNDMSVSDLRAASVVKSQPSDWQEVFNVLRVPRLVRGEQA